MLWNHSYETGVDEIDRQNLDMVSRLCAMINPDASTVRFEQLVNFELIVPRYFEREGVIHDECGYYDADMHKFTHESCLQYLRKIKRNFIDRGPTLENEMIFVNDALMSLRTHIMDHDKPFAEFYRRNFKNAETH